jgi:hypothetical protein
VRRLAEVEEYYKEVLQKRDGELTVLQVEIDHLKNTKSLRPSAFTTGKSSVVEH